MIAWELTRAQSLITDAIAALEIAVEPHDPPDVTVDMRGRLRAVSRDVGILVGRATGA